MLRDPNLLSRPYAVREALASARIEGTQASFTDVYQAEANRDKLRRSDVIEVHAHITALEHGLSIAKKDLQFETLCIVHRVLMSRSAHPETAGQLRQHPVWLGSPTARPETAVFVPPVGEEMKCSLDDLFCFIQRPPRLPTLIKAALLHYQFLTIHPFIDGNGRIGRMLVLLYLYREGLLSVPLLYISPYLEDRRREYSDRLQAVRERGEIQEWIQFFLTAVAVQASDGVTRARQLLSLRERYRKELSGSRSRALEVVEILFTNPIVTSGLIRRALGVSNQGALNLIRSIESRGWLRDAGIAGRGGATQWVATDVLEIISESQI